jgi:two-component sensor histidine kinase
MLASVESLNAELREAGEALIGNGDLLRAVLSGCGDCIKILDLDGRLQFMSEGGKRVMEVDDFGPLKGCPWPDFWAGDGNVSAKKAIELARRGHVARFKGAAETAKGNPRYWDVQVSPIAGPDGKPVHLLSISRDITAEWNAEQALREAAEEQRSLTIEMSHRINNTLALVGAIAWQTIRGDDVEAARDRFSSRLRSLSEANKILLQNGELSSSIADVVETALAPHRSGTSRITVNGPNFPVPPRQALSLALAIHELATNATKYGALSNDAGTINVQWGSQIVDDELTFVFQWEEKCGRAIIDPAPSRKGFGSRLIHEVFARDFGGTVHTTFEASGLVCKLQSPFRILAVAPS